MGPAVNIKTHDMLNPQERRFLEAAEKGDRPTLIACLNQVFFVICTRVLRFAFHVLQKNVPLNVNCADAMGRTAIEIAVDNGKVCTLCLTL